MQITTINHSTLANIDQNQVTNKEARQQIQTEIGNADIEISQAQNALPGQGSAYEARADNLQQRYNLIKSELTPQQMNNQRISNLLNELQGKIDELRQIAQNIPPAQAKSSNTSRIAANKMLAGKAI